MVQQLRENQELDSTQVVDYLLTALDNTPTEETEETNND
jgi:hypothetical protein